MTSEIKITPTDRRILSALDEHGDMSPRDVADQLGREYHHWTGRKLRRLLDAGFVRVARWERNTDGLAIPIYSVTPGPNSKRPGALGSSVWSKRYRKRLEERGGEQYLKARSSLALLVSITRKAA